MRGPATVNIAPDGPGLLRWIREAVLPSDRPTAVRMLGTFSVTIGGVTRPISAMEVQDTLDAWQREVTK